MSADDSLQKLVHDAVLWLLNSTESKLIIPLVDMDVADYTIKKRKHDIDEQRNTRANNLRSMGKMQIDLMSLHKNHTRSVVLSSGTSIQKPTIADSSTILLLLRFLLKNLLSIVKS
ncbi:hypothetical protein AKO1_001474 [Acrasis kona]|uniref:Uncharacterized protein n=1 Tax=Acrasis kona TaxID=1008807 RepID=A0AAW2ZB16_9EUKA